MENDKDRPTGQLPLPVVKRQTIERVLPSFNEHDLERAKYSGNPLFTWLSQLGDQFLMGGFVCRLALFREAEGQGRKLEEITQETLDEFDKVLKDRQEKLSQQAIDNIKEIPPELAPSFAVWKPENGDLMDFFALDLPRRLWAGGYTPLEIGALQAGVLHTYEISRIQATKSR